MTGVRTASSALDRPNGITATVSLLLFLGATAVLGGAREYLTGEQQ